MRLIEAVEASRATAPLPAARSDSSDEDGGDEIQPRLPAVEVAAMAAAHATTGMAGAPVFDDEGPAWPDEASESAMRVEISERGETLSSKAAREAAEIANEEAAEKKNLPKLDDLVERIPADVRDTLEELFRVKFVKVARSPKKALKGEG